MKFVLFLVTAANEKPKSELINVEKRDSVLLINNAKPQ